MSALLFLSVNVIQHVFWLVFCVLTMSASFNPQISANFCIGSSSSHAFSRSMPSVSIFSCVSVISFSGGSGAGAGSGAGVVCGAVGCGSAAGCVVWHAASKSRLIASNAIIVFFIYIT